LLTTPNSILSKSGCSHITSSAAIGACVEIDLLIKRLIENWEDDLTQEKIPDKNKDKIKERIELAKGNI